MKTKLKFFLVFLAVLVGTNSVCANEAYFKTKAIECLSSVIWTTITGATQNGSVYSYQQDIYWLWSGDTNEIDLTNQGSDKDFIWTVETIGTVEVVGTNSTLTSSTTNEDGESIKYYNVVGSDTSSGTIISFQGTNGNSSYGTLKVTATNPDFGGVTYSCSYTIFFHLDNNTKVKKWDFYTKLLSVGRSSDTSSSLYAHISEWESITASGETVFFYKNDIGTSTNPVDIAEQHLFISETNGLLFYAPIIDSHGTFGLYNDNPSDGICSDRCIALKPGAKLQIPASVFSAMYNPRVRIKMGRYGAPDGEPAGIDLTISNAYDALGLPYTLRTTSITQDGTSKLPYNPGTEIVSTYKIGGCAWWGDKGDNHQRGEYHFVINDRTQPFEITVTAGQWLNLYTIEVYDSKELVTENAVLGSNYQLLTKKLLNGTTTAPTGTYHLHYRGKGEPTQIYTNYNSTSGSERESTETMWGKDWEYWPTGTVNCTNSSFTSSSNDYSYTPAVGQFGTFRIRIGCYTSDNKYCTDYASRTQAVGYLETKSYPRTWDFTDVKPYSDAPNSRLGIERDYAYYKRWNKQNLWESNSDPAMRISTDADGHNLLFCGGSQLWYGETIIPELEGLGFGMSNMNVAYNGKLSMTNDGLKLLHQVTNCEWWSFRIAVPEVPDNGVLYVRVHPEIVTNDGFYNAGYSYGDYVKPVPSKNIAGNEETRFNSTNTFTVTDESGDLIYVVPGNATSALSNITLYFNGVTIKKIAVSTDPKAVNKYGWTTESRGRDIDPELTSYMTGQNFTTYLVTDANYSEKTVTLTPILTDNLMPAATDGSVNACIIQNNAGEAVEIVNGGFHLFVPDIHDSENYTYMKKTVTGGTTTWAETTESPQKSAVDTSNSKMKAKLSSGTVPAVDPYSSYKNFAFTYGYYDANYNTGEAYGNQEEKDGGQAFYRIEASGASSIGNQGYLSIPASFSAARYTIVFADDEDDNQATGIAGNNANSMENVNTRYYNLNGQQLDGQPIRQGLYIVNGKKMYVK